VPLVAQLVERWTVVGQYISVTHNYIHSQLFLTLLHMYTAYNHLYVRNYNHLFHVYTVYVHYTLIFTALSHIKSPNVLSTSSLADFCAVGHFHRLSHTVAHANPSIHTAGRLRYLLRKTLAEVLLREFTS
jgi:hypothetical protein